MERGHERVALLRGIVWVVLSISASLAAGSEEFAFVPMNLTDGSDGGEEVQSVPSWDVPLDRPDFSWDLFSVAVPKSWLVTGSQTSEALEETRLTDGKTVNYHGHWVGPGERGILLDQLREAGVDAASDCSLLLHVSERNGRSALYVTLVPKSRPASEPTDVELSGTQNLDNLSRRQTQETELPPSQGHITVRAPLNHDTPVVFERVSMAGGRIAFVSAANDWVSVCATDLKDGTTTLLTPPTKSVTDVHPAISPSGKWVAALSIEWPRGEKLEVRARLVVFRSDDGTRRLTISETGREPAWGGDDRTIYYSRNAEDEWGSVFRITLPENYLVNGTGELLEERITPPGLHAYHPAPSPDGKWIAVETRRAGLEHVEIFHLATGTFVKITENIAPNERHFDPFVSESGDVGYRRFRGLDDGLVMTPYVDDGAVKYRRCREKLDPSSTGCGPSEPHENCENVRYKT